jgi:hypothetical protein
MAAAIAIVEGAREPANGRLRYAIARDKALKAQVKVLWLVLRKTGAPSRSGAT